MSNDNLSNIRQVELEDAETGVVSEHSTSKSPELVIRAAQYNINRTRR